jgi:hypothetical protein
VCFRSWASSARIAPPEDEDAELRSMEEFMTRRKTRD